MTVICQALILASCGCAQNGRKPVLILAFSTVYAGSPVWQSGGRGRLVDGVLRRAPRLIRGKAARVAALGCALIALGAIRAAPQSAQSSGDATTGTTDPTTPALCPVVYPDDQTPAERGYHYTFFGNAFFINDQGYLLTVAHVLEAFRDGGQPYILVNRTNAPPELVRVAIIAKDPQHDVAILRATPNPFSGRYEVAFVPLAAKPAERGEAVIAVSLHPKKAQDAHSFEYQREDFSPGTVLGIESTQLQKPGPPAEVFLLSHPVVKGQSGSPVLSLDSRAAVGLIEGLWLRGTTIAKSAATPTDTPGAAVPIRYATALLEQSHVGWTPAPRTAPAFAEAGPQTSHGKP
jgi:hypothetical protein